MSTAAPAPASDAPPAAPPTAQLPTSRRELFNRIRTGDLGSIRVLVLLAIIWTIFQVQETRFLSATNLTNLALQITAVGLISIGVVLVLLLGEIDLSVGAVSGLCSAIMAVLSVKHGWPAIPAILAGILVGTCIGIFQGFISTKFGIPTFVVTLAGLLGWQGAQLKVLGETGTVNLTPGLITDLAGTFLSKPVGWLVGIAAVALFVAMQLAGRARRAKAGLFVTSPAPLGIRLGAVAIATLASIAIVNQDRGVPLAAVILVGCVAVMDFIMRRTRFGRQVFAVGGNAEAARRAGINVPRVRVTVFAIGSSFAAFGG